MQLRFGILLGCWLLLVGTLFSQRYLEPVFAEVDSQTFRYARVDGEDLRLDLFLPAGDKVQDKPVLLYVHGGGFAGGRRNERGFVSLARNLAARGYAVASISYRLTMRGQSFSCDQPMSNKVSTFQAAAEDVWAATRFLASRHERWGIDPGRIVLAGSSAGAEAILHAAYAQYGMPGSTQDTFRYAGLISMAGAMIDPGWITAESAVPSLLFHGTCDNLVPYATAPHHYCAPGEPGYLILHGAKTIADRLRQLGKPYYLFTACGGAHEWAGRPIVDREATIVEFLYRDVMQGNWRQVHEVVRQSAGSCDYFEAPFPFCID
jgi:acetyl esterase/lipase